ncbi:UDP-N-acetylmuramoyl-tripeptide--D-alanyl-D-alanine ligase [Fulvivirga sp.]|uniref:UDP-N-acetylmuramoyl-tripeptide--D-alanyl-D- alanine ligase n=1 Tax=Fulvivirga sp. TaxID=1931237 RepID=UPI0032EF5258
MHTCIPMIDKLYQHYLQYPVICTDTRKITDGCIFFALKGPNFNANSFAKEALEKGASLCVVDESEYAINDQYLLVEDALQALQDLAKRHRVSLKIPVIGLTGSNGKTTTKELLTVALSPKYNVLATKGNLNNHIGVPLTILSIKPEHELAIIEMGANHVGEIAMLCGIANPTHGLITNIGKAHLEGFGGIEGVIRGKSELYHHLIQNDGVVWINSSNEILSNMAKRFKNPLFYPKKGDYYEAEFIEANPNIIFKTEDGNTVTTHLIGKYNFENIAVALCAAKYFEVPADLANRAVADYNPENNRSQVLKQGSNTIILDAYNANPTSMASALENLSKMDSSNKVVILGDMKELGEDSIKEHESLGIVLSQYNFENVFLCGEEMRAAASKYPNANHALTREALLEMLKDSSLKNALILIKGSRSMGLEETLKVL